MNILVIGDVVSAKGCEFLRSVLPTFKKVKGIDFCIANGENSAVGNGITPFSAQYLFDSGVDFITTGNHVYRRREFYEMLDERDDIIRPANFFKGNPGSGYSTVDMGFAKVGIINLSGTVYMDRCDNPFTVVDEILPKLSDCRITLVDFHAEATAEKRAMGFYLDGRVSAVFGTHTHVITGDATVLPSTLTESVSNVGWESWNAALWNTSRYSVCLPSTSISYTMRLCVSFAVVRNTVSSPCSLFATFWR
jgi:metallophosphoesterase (TIGR00282 family)